MNPLLETGFYQLVEGRHGRFLANPRDIYIGRSLIEYGEFSELEWRVIAQAVPEGGVVIEAGANIGAHTVPISRKVGPKGLVFAFEPQPLIFQQLCANLALNDLVNVQAFNAACGDSPGWLPVRCVDPAIETNFGGIPLARLSTTALPTRVRLECLDEAVAVDRLDLIKADVEGMELAVLQGAAGLISRFRPVLYVEAHRPDEAPPLLRWIEAAGYKAWWHLPEMFHARNHAGRQDNIWNSAIRSRNVICLPSERAGEMKSFRPVSGPEDHPAKWR